MDKKQRPLYRNFHQGRIQDIRQIRTYIHSKQEKNWGNMTSCIQLKDNFLLLLFHLITEYLVRERFERFFSKARKLRENGKKRGKKHQNKKVDVVMSIQTIKTITNEFECFDVRPLKCNCCFYLQQQNNTALFYKSQTAFFLKGIICY